jgi:hypothetical protein
VEICENGSRVTSATPLSWEVRGNSEKPLLHLWSENCNVTRRVAAITGNSQDHLALARERSGRAKPERMEIVRLEYAPAPRDLSREAYSDQLRRILAEQFPDETLEKSAPHRIWNTRSRKFIRAASSNAVPRT